MWKRTALGLGLCFLLAGCGQQEDDVKEPASADDPVVQVLPLDGDTVSPDGRFEVRLEGQDAAFDGEASSENIRIYDTQSGDVLWEDAGSYAQSVLWSPEGNYLAMAYAGQAWNQIIIFETETWTAWNMTLPDGTDIPEYAFFPYDVPWGKWLDEDTLEFTVGRGSGNQKSYRTSLRAEDGVLVGDTLEQTEEKLPGTYDFDHDGTPESVEVVTVLAPKDKLAAWYELRVGEELWMQEASLAHVGWTSIFACKVDGQDYLMRYMPGMWQGFATYDYQLFSLSEAGEEVLFREKRVEFDNNFGSDLHQNFDAAAIADFLWEVREHLVDSTLLLSTEDGIFQSGGSGWQMTAYPFGELMELDSKAAMEAALRQYEADGKREQGVT